MDATVETAKQPAWMETEEYKEILARHEKLVKNGEIALLELKPSTKLTFGGFHVIGKIKDKYGNLVLDTANREDRIGIAPVGASLRFDKKEDLRFIYAIYNCDVLRSRCALEGEEVSKHQHRFILSDKEKISQEYASARELNIQYMNKFYSFDEDTCSFLCNSVGANANASIGVKRADLCRIWESDSSKRAILKRLIDSPDMEYYQAVYMAIKQGNPTEGTGFYKTQNGVYKHNEQILGNSVENVVAYLKTNDDVYVAIRKGQDIEKKLLKSKPK